jgi:hypothetical protein
MTYFSPLIYFLSLVCSLRRGCWLQVRKTLAGRAVRLQVTGVLCPATCWEVKVPYVKVLNQLPTLLKRVRTFEVPDSARKNGIALAEGICIC